LFDVENELEHVYIVVAVVTNVAIKHDRGLIADSDLYKYCHKKGHSRCMSRLV